MQKIYLFTCFFIYSSCCFAQTDTLSQADKAMLDSMMANDEFLKLMNEKPKNALDISVGIGNGSFSSHNNAANATGFDNKIIYTPSVVYRIKNGISFGATGFLTSDTAGAVELYQTGISAAYDHYGKKIKTGISYTRYLADKNKYNSKSLYQNDLYGYIKRAKGVLQPGLSLGFANGTYKEIEQVSFILKRPLRGDTLISGKDSTDNKATYFSVSASIEHEFSFYKLFSKKDEFDFTPSLIINFGSDKLTRTHTNKIYDRPIASKLGLVKKNEATNDFQLQSIAAAFNFTYAVGKFILQPNVYIDYYLPESTYSRWSTIFSVTAGISF